ncbi:hypothetical protein B0H14DRAFT_2731165 [Mycena olivaceomarginata]|nr:hypothetical protein B0H14DRAFT_2731165 [Mycena olivaceomarginata]
MGRSPLPPVRPTRTTSTQTRHASERGRLSPQGLSVRRPHRIFGPKCDDFDSPRKALLRTRLKLKCLAWASDMNNCHMGSARSNLLDDPFEARCVRSYLFVPNLIPYTYPNKIYKTFIRIMTKPTMAPDVTANILSYRRLPHMDLASAAYSPAGDANVALPRPTHNQDVVTPSDHDLNHMVPYVAYDARGCRLDTKM